MTATHEIKRHKNHTEIFVKGWNDVWVRYTLTELKDCICRMTSSKNFRKGQISESTKIIADRMLEAYNSI